MSKYKDCQVFVDANGLYCCNLKRIRIGPNQCAQIALVNTGPINLMFYPSGDTDEPAILHSVLPEGVTTISECGMFKLDFDCAEIEGTDAPTEPNEQILICHKCIDKTTHAFISEQLQLICEKLLLTGDVTALSELLEAISLLCTKIAQGNETQISVLNEVSALCEKLLQGNENTTLIVSEIKELCNKLNETNTTLNSTATAIVEGFGEVITCLKDIKELLKENNEKLCQILGEPSTDCPACPMPVKTVCDVKWFLTYAQQEFTITGTTFNGATPPNITLPVNGNSAPELTQYKDDVVAYLASLGIAVNEQQGRDGWTLSYSGPCPIVTTTGDGNIQPQCENCVEV